MTATPHIRVLKFGSSVLRSEADLPRAVHEIYREWRAGNPVAAVVSAFGSTTDDLLKRAEQLGLPPQPGALAALLATGEATAAALLSLALDRSGIPCLLLDPHQAGLLTSGSPLDSDLTGIDTARIRRELRHGVVVLPGFVGRDPAGRTTLLGRGGSDLTAIVLARELAGFCRFFKDVDGLYTADPARNGNGARRYAVASWETVRRIGGGVIQPRAVRHAQEAGLEFEITAPGAFLGTRVGAGPDRLAPASRPVKPLRVALLGCGTVGGGVLEHLFSRPGLFQVAGVAVRDRERARRSGLSRRLLSAAPLAVAELDVDVVVELLGGREPARRAVVRALELGRSVVTANKALLAEGVEDLSRLATRRGASLRYSASVGGALPALETARRLAGRVRSFSGVLNGTCNYVLDRWAAGLPFDEALAEARAAGFAEADPTLDLDGSDSAQKLALVAREAFGVSLRWDRIFRRGISDLDRPAFEEAGRRESVVRLVATCEHTAAGLRASVQPLELPASHPLAQTTGAGNALRIETDDGEVVDLAARGAGRWPTAEAVLADLYDLAADRRRNPGEARELKEGVA